MAELLSRLFALIQADMLVPSTVRAVLARLQVAAPDVEPFARLGARVALVDYKFGPE